jgi:hypothetical protein
MTELFIHLSNLIYLVISYQYYILNLPISTFIYMMLYIFSTIYHLNRNDLTLLPDFVFALLSVANNFILFYYRLQKTLNPEYDTTLKELNYINLIGSILCFSSLYIKKIQDCNYNIYHSLWHLISGLGALLIII